MTGKITEYINDIFKSIPESEFTIDLKEEIIVNLVEKFNDLIDIGKDEGTAYEMVIDGIGDPEELIKYINAQINEATEKINIENNEEQSVQLVNTIKINVFSLDVVFFPSNNTIEAKVVTTRYKKQIRSTITTERVGDELIIKQERPNWFIPFLTLFERLEVYLPVNYNGNLDVNSFSGKINISHEATFNYLGFKAISGNIEMTNIKCNSYALNSVSGNINIDVLIGDGSMKCTSGNITIDKIFGTLHNFKLTSGNLKIRDMTGKINAKVTSGNTNISSFNGSGFIETFSGNNKIELCTLSGDCEFSATSGNVVIYVSKNISFNFECRCHSGSIKSEFECFYNKKGNHANATVGINPEYKLLAQTASGNIKTLFRY